MVREGSEMRRKEAMKILIEYYTTVSEEWDRYVVPITGVFAEEMVQAAQIKPKYHVLDVGTGTGVAALLAASAVGSQGSVVGVDLTEGMMRVAGEKAKKAGYQHLSFKVMDVQDLDFPTKSFDVVISNLAFPIGEKKSVRQVYRVLKDNGRFSFNGGRIERTETENVFMSIFSKYKVPQPSLQLERERQAMNFESFERNPERVKSLLNEVGFQNITVQKKPIRLSFQAQRHISI